MSLGASHMRTALRVILPLIAPGMLAAAIFAFIHSFDEVVISSFIAGANLQTLPLRIWQDIQYQVDPVIAAITLDATMELLSMNQIQKLGEDVLARVHGSRIAARLGFAPPPISNRSHPSKRFFAA